MKRTLMVAMLVAASSVVFSQPTRIGLHAQTGKPGPEHKRLEVFVGSWTYVADLKPAFSVLPENVPELSGFSGCPANSSFR